MKVDLRHDPASGKELPLEEAISRAEKQMEHMLFVDEWARKHIDYLEALRAHAEIAWKYHAARADALEADYAKGAVG